jgi:hypothetical protein
MDYTGYFLKRGKRIFDYYQKLFFEKGNFLCPYTGTGNSLDGGIQ